MRSTRINVLQLAIFSLGFALVAGCNPPPPADDCEATGACEPPVECDVGDQTPECVAPTVCDHAPCRLTYWCTAPLPAPTASVPDPQPLRFCNYDVISQEPGYRLTCAYDQQEADDFCQNECLTAGAQNGYTAQETAFLCQNSAAVPELFYVNDEPIVCTAPPIPYQYGPEYMCPEADDVGPNVPPPTVPPEEDLPHVFCRGKAEPTKPHPNLSYDFNDNQISYWLETWELDEWHYTPAFVQYDTNCGYKVYRIQYEMSGLNDDQICQQMCSDHVAALELDAQNPLDPEAARILHDNCASFVAESLCADGPVAPPLVGPFNVPLTLAATLQQGTTYVTTQFSGELSYSTYDCLPGTTSCGIVINEASLDMDYPVSGQWMGSASSIPFSSSDLSLHIRRPTTGAYSLVTHDFLLDAFTLPLQVEGAITVGSPGSTSASQSVDIETTNTGAISGFIASDGSVSLSGSFAFGPGVTLYFGTPAPQ
jgi:hypothetical protein